MLLYLKGTVNGKMVSKLLNAVNELRKEDNLHIYFTSHGGETDAAEVIVDVINKHKDVIGMSFHGDIYSAAMDIFLRVECERHLLRDVRGMYHYSYQHIVMAEGAKPSGIGEEFALKELKRTQERTLKFIKEIGFTSKEVADIKRGMDVYFTAERMLQLINGTKQ